MAQGEKVGVSIGFSWRYLIPRAISNLSFVLVASAAMILVIGFILGIAGIIIGLGTGVVTIVLAVIVAAIVLVAGLVVGFIGLIAVLMLAPPVGLAFAGWYLFTVHPALISIPIVIFLLIFGGLSSIWTRKLSKRFVDKEKS